MALLCCVSLLNILLLVELAVSEDPFKITENRDKWIDPNSMFNTDSLTENQLKLNVNDDDVSSEKFCKFNHIMKEELAECRKKLLSVPKIASNCQCEFDEKSPCQSEVAAVKHMIRLLGRKLDINLDNPKSVSDSAQNYVVRLTVSQSDLATWNELLTETKLKHATLIEALEKVGNMINTASLRTVVSESLIKQTNCSNVSESDTSLVYIFTWLNFVALVVALGYIVLVIWRKSFFLFVTFMFCTLFALSFVWTWYHMYKTEQAKSMAILHKVSLNSCRRIEDMSIWQYIGHLYFKLEDTCTEYHKAVIVDPFLEVKPLKVLGVTISEFVFAPLEPLAKEINRSFAALRNNLSTYNFALLIITFLSLTIPLLLLVGRYRFRALYGLISVEPAAVTKKSHTIPIENKSTIDSSPSKKQLKRLHRKALLKLKN
ncbi:Chloride channel CLIC-like protein 1 [Trichinella pseudospiralis]|uniref:Chloride channel CLIC-like protein 1 n=1 Tax=Trichinella pseudospiralis TaxID=6337 RepID=A0A0V1J0R9_TRIPS|nr:Chloride channel CLIC-like protein 1 [Trichinella pseudospiralis]KRZ28586.1 Chloride channel CLIC-like protein 1 [Trichinella pseudospiralis]